MCLPGIPARDALAQVRPLVHVVPRPGKRGMDGRPRHQTGHVMADDAATTLALETGFDPDDMQLLVIDREIDIVLDQMRCAIAFIGCSRMKVF